MKATYLTVALATLLSSPLALAAASDGAGLYRDNCSQCHGERGMGGPVGMGAMMHGGGMMNGGAMMNGQSSGGAPAAMSLQAPKLVGDAANWTPALFERAVLKGIDDEGKPLNRVMPHWGSASFSEDHGKPPSKAEIHAIQKYLQTLK